MSKSRTFDALYGGILDNPLEKPTQPTIPAKDETGRIVAVLKSRAEGYFDRAETFRAQKELADCEAAMGTCRELAYVAKMLEEDKLEGLEQAGK